MNLPDFTAVILDMDGLVLDTEKTYFLAWQEAVRSMGFTLTNEFCQKLTGESYQQVERLIVNELGGSFKLESFRELSSKYWRKIVSEDGIAVKDGFYSLLKVLQQYNIPYSLATNSYLENAVECLKLAGIIEYFPHIVARDQVKNAKPAPDIFLQAAKLLKVAIEETLVVEDSDIGVQAGKSAGAFVILIPSTPYDGHSSEHIRLKNLARLAEMIERKRSRHSV